MLHEGSLNAFVEQTRLPKQVPTGFFLLFRVMTGGVADEVLFCLFSPTQ